MINSGYSENLIQVRFIISWLFKICGLICGVGVMFLQERFRKMLIWLSYFSIATIFLRYTYGSFLIYCTPTYHESGMTGMSLQTFTWINVLVRWLMDAGFSAVVIYYLTRPGVKQLFKQAQSG
jgi:hypothetical protein